MLKNFLFLQKVMKLFQELYKIVPILVGNKNFNRFDLSAPNPFRKYLYDGTNWLGYIVLVSSVVLAAGSFAFEAKTLQEYSDSFYAFVTLSNDTFYFICIQWLCHVIFELNEDYENVIAERKSTISMTFSIDAILYIQKKNEIKNSTNLRIE